MTFAISSLLNPAAFDHPVQNIELIETHISWVILTGAFAYKIKKPVDFGFLDFSTLEKRHKYCLNELQLNRRLAADIYLNVVAITGTDSNLSINGEGEAIEYAVKMKQFPQSAQLDNMLANGELDVTHMDAIASMVASFHQSIAIADKSSDFGNSHAVYQPVEENFIQIREHLNTYFGIYQQTLEELETWSKSAFTRLESYFQQRKANGFIRECHGDMHLRNMLWLDSGSHSGPAAFDCIEFNANLRWIDVISEVAFLVMDLQDRKQHVLASRFLNRYLELTGDYAGLAALPYYLCYRALVRAKVSVIRLGQDNISPQEKEQVLAEFDSYLALASSFTHTRTAKLIIMRGLSASGKSTVSQQLLDASNMIRIRSDVERKRLFESAMTNNERPTGAANKIDNGIYSSSASEKTYAKLASLASQVIDAGYSVIVDAAFLKYEQRKIFQQLADSLSVPYIILQLTAPDEVLRQRIIDRKNDVSDADLAVLEHQLAHRKPLEDSETDSVVLVDTTMKVDTDALLKSLER